MKETSTNRYNNYYIYTGSDYHHRLRTLHSLITSGSMDMYRYFRKHALDDENYLLFRHIIEPGSKAEIIGDEYIVILKRSTNPEGGKQKQHLTIIGVDDATGRFFISVFDVSETDISLSNIDVLKIRDLFGFNKSYREYISSKHIEAGDKIRVLGSLIIHVTHVYNSFREMIHDLARRELESRTRDLAWSIYDTVYESVYTINEAIKKPVSTAKLNTLFALYDFMSLIDASIDMLSDIIYIGQEGSKKLIENVKEIRRIKEAVKEIVMDIHDDIYRSPDTMSIAIERSINLLREFRNITNNIQSTLATLSQKSKMLKILKTINISNVFKDIGDVEYSHRRVMELLKMSPEGFRNYIEIAVRREVGNIDIEIKTPDKKNQYSVGDFIASDDPSKFYTLIASKYADSLAEEVVRNSASKIADRERRYIITLDRYRLEVIGCFIDSLYITRPQKIVVRHPEYGVREVSFPSPAKIRVALSRNILI